MIEESIFQPVNNFEYPDLPNIDLNSSLDSNNLIYNYSELLKDKAEEKYNKDLEDWINSHNEDLGNDLDNLFYPETNNQTYKFKQSKGYNAVKSVMDKLVTDSTKKNILLKIAEKESNFNSKAKNPKSSASGLFGFINASKKKYGYGNSIAEQVSGASRYYDDFNKKLTWYINTYGDRGLNDSQLMYGMWFRPASMINYLKTGKDNYKDAQGTGLNKIFTKMAQKGMKFQNKNQYIINAKRKLWNYIKEKTTNDIVKQQFNNNKYIIRINNVSDKGDSGIPKTSKYYVSRTNT